jgi:MoaA/NifB/PqqE/SkfB family radical SAM enzyme
MSLTLELAREVCVEGYAAGYRHLHLTGGEPLLWEGLSDLLDVVFSLGYRSVFLNTNGILITGRVARRLAQYPHLALSVSLQGPEALHDGMRGSGSHRQACRGIARALDAGLKLTIFTAIGNALLAQLPAFAADVYGTFPGIERLMLIQMIRVNGDHCGLSRELLNPEGFKRLVQTVSGLNLCGFKTDVLNDPLVNVVAEMLQLPLVAQSHSLRRPGKLIVRANRDMTLAHSTWEVLGQYAPGMIEEVLADDRYRKAVERDTITCPTCGHVDRCRRNGMRQPSAPVMDTQSEIPFCQRVLACIGQPS